MSEAAVHTNRAPRAAFEAPFPRHLPVPALRVLAAVPAWWRRQATAAGAFGDALDVLSAVDACPPVAPSAFRDVTIREDLVNATAEELAAAYVVALGNDGHAVAGRHYTPMWLADALWRQSVEVLADQSDGLVLDNSCGAGSLLIPPLRTWLAQHADTHPEWVLASARTTIAGRDQDAVAVWLGNVILAAELLPWWRAIPATRRRRLPALLTVSDGLEPQEPPAGVVVMNPPYGRVRLDSKDRRTWSHAVYGHANLYGLFLAAALDQVAPGGVVSALVPAGWLGGAYFQRLRRTLSERAPLVRLAHVSDRGGVFATGVLQETVLATFRVGGSRQQVSCEQVKVNDTVRRETIGKAQLPQPGHLPWLLPRSHADLPLVQAASHMDHRLGDHGWQVATGPLVWNRHKAQLSARPRNGSTKVVWAADLEGGVVHRSRRRNDLRHVQPRSERERQVLTLAEPAVLVQRTTAPEQPRRLLAAHLSAPVLEQWGGKVVVENHLNVLTATVPDSALSAPLLVALLDSPALDRLYRCLTGSVAVSAYELSALPLPSSDVLGTWQDLDDEALAEAIARTYGLPGD